MAARPRRLFRWDVIWRGERLAVDDSYELVFRPGIFEVIQALPKRCESSLNLACVRFVVESAKGTYLQLPHYGLAEVLGPGVHTQRDQEPAIYTLFSQTLFALLRPDDALLLELPCLSLRLGLPPRLECRIAGLRAAPNPQERRAPPAVSRAVYATSCPLVGRGAGCSCGGRRGRLGTRAAGVPSRGGLRLFALAIAHGEGGGEEAWWDCNGRRIAPGW